MQTVLLAVVVACTQDIVLVLLEQTEFASVLRLRALAVLSLLDRVLGCVRFPGQNDITQKIIQDKTHSTP
jgi:hypothetical protein